MGAVGSLLGGPVTWVYDYFFGKYTCQACEKISPGLCRVEDGKEVWFDGHEGVIVIGLLAVASSVVVFFLGEDLYLLTEVFGNVGTTVGDAVKVLAWPFTESLSAVKWFVGKTFGVLDSIADYTGTYRALWRLVGGLMVLLGLTEAGYEITKVAFGEPASSPFWKLYLTFNKPVEVLHSTWNEFFSKWNPLRYAIYFVLIPMEVAIITFTLFVNGLNPFYWWSKLKNKVSGI